MNSPARTRRRRSGIAITPGHFAVADRGFGQSRQRLIGYLVKLNCALDDDLADLSHALLCRFCDSLLEYLSAGRLHLLQRPSLRVRSSTLLEATNEAAMAFYDRFGNVTDLELADVKDALEQIARVLCTRFELEDELLGPHRR